ncbi:hypothetical protein O1L55_40705 [Streptomyces albulus]|nr:hypothetical protein [Streptomyces noursei]
MMDPSTNQGTRRSPGAWAHFPRPAHDEASVRGFPRSVRARVTGPDSGIDLGLVQRLTRQALEFANNGAELS